MLENFPQDKSMQPAKRKKLNAQTEDTHQGALTPPEPEPDVTQSILRNIFVVNSLTDAVIVMKVSC